MSGKRSRTGLLSRLAAPLAQAARRVVGRSQRDADETRRLMESALAEAEKAPARLTDDAFRMFTEQLAKEEDGAFQIKLHIVSLVEFREAVGDKWSKLSDKVMMIAEGVINMHLGAGNIFNRQGSDFFILLFRTCDNTEARRRAVIIAQELGTRLVGDQFVGSEVPLALAAEVSTEDGLHEDGSVLAVVAESTCDVGLIGYEMAMLVSRTEATLTPQLISEMRGQLPVDGATRAPVA